MAEDQYDIDDPPVKKAKLVKSFGEETTTAVPKAATQVSDFGEEVTTEPLKKNETLPTTAKDLQVGAEKFVPTKSLLGGDFLTSNVEDYNRRFEDVTGHREFSLSEPLKSDNLLSVTEKKKKEVEAKKFETYRQQEKKINDTLTNIHFGNVSVDEIAELSNNPFGKKIATEIINEYAPEVIDDVSQIEVAVKNIKTKNRINATQQLDNIDNESLTNIQSALRSLELKTDIKEFIATPGAGALQTNVTAIDKLPDIDFTSKQSVANAIKFVEDKGYLVDKEGKKSDYTLDRLHNDLKNVYEKLVNETPIDATIEDLSGRIENAVVGKQVLAEGKEGETDYGTNDKVRAEHFKLGLNYIKDLQPGTYKGIILGLTKKGEISETDYQQVSRIGQQLLNKRVFKNAAYEPEWIDKETSFDYTTHQDKKAEIAGQIGEWLKENGYKNVSSFAPSVIRMAAAKAGINDKEIVEELVLDEGKLMYDAIPKSGGFEAVIRGIETPIAGIKSTFDKWVNESPAETYLRSKKFDTGSAQLVPDAKGQLGNELPSDRGNFWYDVLEGAGQFIPQVLLTRGIGTPLGALGRTAAQSAAISTYGGTFISTYLQTYGDAYSAALRKTGDPSTARLMGGIDATVSALAEEILPDVKIAGKAFNGLKTGFVDDMVGMLKKGGDISDLGKKAQPLITKFTKGLANIEGQEISEEVVTQLGSYINESIFSPGTVKDRDLGKEVLETIKATATSMLIPAVLGAGGQAVNKEFTVDGLNAAATNFDDTKSALQKSLLNETITQDQYNQGISVLSTHRESLFSAPVVNDKGETLTQQARKDFAYQETLVKINNEKLKNETGVQKEVTEQKIKDAEDVQRSILLTEKAKDNIVLPEPKTEDEWKQRVAAAKTEEEKDRIMQQHGEWLIEQQNAFKEKPSSPTNEEPILNEQEVVAIDGLKGKDFSQSIIKPYTDIIQDENSSPQEKKNALRGLSDQLTAKGTEVEVGTALGKEADLIYNLGLPVAEESAALQEITQPKAPEQGSAVVDEITVGDMVGKVGSYNGEKGSFYQDGQAVVFKVDGKPKEYELGNLDEIKDTPIKNFGITHEQSIVAIDNEGNFNVRGEKYANPFEDRGQNPLDAIAYDEDGNIVNVRMKTPDGERRTFKGNVAEDLAYQIHLKEINKNNETRNNFEQHLNEDAAAKKEMDNGGLLETTPQPTVENDATVSREKIEPKVIEVKLAEPITVTSETETKIQQPPENKKPTDTEANKVEQPAEEGAGDPPIETPPVKEEAEEEFKNEPKAILNKIYNSKKVSKSFADKFKDNPKGLRYNPQSHEQARALAKEIIDEFGVENSIAMAEAGRFDGDVNSMIFAEGIDRTFTEEQKAKTQDEKIEAAERWADYAIRYDEAARQKGKFISAIYDFYKKSPLGVILSERAKKDEAFKDWFIKREGGYKELFEAIKDEPEFKDFVKEKVDAQLKQERTISRMKRREKIGSIFDKAKIKGDQLSSSIIPPPLWNAAVEVMKQAALAGESLVSIIESGVKYIKENNKQAWDEQAFRDEWNERLSGMDGQQVKTDEEKLKQKQEKLLDRFRKKLSGLNEQQKEDIIRRSFKKLVENKALEYDEFKKIIADVMGLGELSADEVTKLSGFIQDMNAVQDLSDNLLKNETKESLVAFEKGVKKAEQSATKLHGMLYNKPKIGQRVRSIIQLSTLGVVSLIKNPFYNIFHQALVRLPKGIFLTALDQSIYGITLLGNKLGFNNPILKPDVNILLAQKGYFSKGAEGGAQSIKQVFTGLTNKDYFQKEVYNSQIKPFQSWRDLWAWGKGNKNLTKGQIADKAIQGTFGIPAEGVARLLNIGDKPFRFAAEAAIAETIATQEFGLKGLEREIFLRLPKEKAKRIYLKRGLSEENAIKKAEAIEQRIISEGEEAVFQQTNVIADAVNKIKQTLSTGDGSHPLSYIGASGAKLFGLLNMPFVKTPVNIAWEVFNLVNPEFALFQSFAYGIKAARTGSSADFLKAKKWMAHAATGWALLSATAYIASIGALSGDDEDEPYKAKEAKGKGTYEKPRRLNISKMYRAAFGGSLETEDGDVNVDLSWFGASGMIMNMQANKYENMTKEQRENMGYVDDLLMRLHSGATEGLTNSVFQGTLTAVDAIRTGKTDQWLSGMLNVGYNFIEPATLAQLSRATRPYDYQLKADSFSEKLKNDIKARFFGKVTPKVNIWGDQIKRENSVGDVTLRMLGIGTYDKDTFGEPIHNDFKKTGDANFYPPALTNKFTEKGKEITLNTEQQLQFETLVGQARKTLVAPYVNDQATYDGSSYKGLSNEEKIKTLQSLYDKGRNIGKKEFLQLHPELIED